MHTGSFVQPIRGRYASARSPYYQKRLPTGSNRIGVGAWRKPA